MPERITVKFGGFGGQGIVLSSVVLGLSAVYDGKFVAQRASYGSEARGGRCKSEVIISDEEISYPLIDELNFLVVMSQQAYDSYLNEVKESGLMLIDPDMVDSTKKRDEIEILEIPAAITADNLGNRIVANMIMLGALQEKTGVVSKESLEKAIKNSVSKRFHEIDIQAMEAGIQIARNLSK
jgi:2-oxoglutarate ferredoxin oxidoreductase subunit gamma